MFCILILCYPGFAQFFSLGVLLVSFAWCVSFGVSSAFCCVSRVVCRLVCVACHVSSVVLSFVVICVCVIWCVSFGVSCVCVCRLSCFVCVSVSCVIGHALENP